MEMDDAKKDMLKNVSEYMVELNYVDPLYGSNANLYYDYWAEL